MCARQSNSSKLRALKLRVKHIAIYKSYMEGVFCIGSESMVLAVEQVRHIALGNVIAVSDETCIVRK